jgi:hypothetical protein
VAFFANLFKPTISAQEKESEETIERLRRYRGKQTAEWLAQQDHQAVITSVINNGGVLPPVKEPPKLEDVDKLDAYDSTVYEPPLEAMYTPISAAVNSAQQQPRKENSQVDWIETMFDEFTRCAGEFDKNNNDQSLMVSVSRPEYRYEASSYDTYIPDAKISVFKGHISTHSWGMLVQGHADTIDIYVLPSEKLLSFTLNNIQNKGFMPFMSITSAIVNEQLEWHIEDEVVSFEKLPLLAKELFRDLVRVASGKMQESELFANYSEGLKLGETVAKGYSPAPKENSSAPKSSVDEILRTWKACADLVKTIESDLLVLAEKEHVAKTSSNEEMLSILKETSSDLRSLSGGLSELLNKYTRIDHMGAS